LIGNRLVDDALHDALDHPLLRQAGLPFGVIGLDLVAEVPVFEQAHLRREEPLSFVVDEVVHPDVVCGDVLRALRARLAHGEVHLGGHAA